MSIGTTGNGIEISDTCRILISEDGGLTYQTQVIITGTTTSNNSRWAFNATGSVSTTYGTLVINNPPNNLSTTAASTITITNLPSVADLRIRIELNANASAENWIIDDVTLTGDPIAAAGLTVCPATPISGLTYLLGTGPSAPQSFTVIGNGLSPVNGNVTVTAPANFQIATNSAGPYSNSITTAYTGGTFAAANYFVRLNGGLPLNDYIGNVSISNGGPAVTLAVSGSVIQDLFFSEYVESASNKYIEIYNPNISSVLLSNYRIVLFTNGNTNPQTTLNLPAINLTSCSVYSIGNATGTIFTPNTTSGITNYNGDDALLLLNISTGDTLDIFGRIGEDPGTAWTAPGGFSTEDRTLVRRPEIQVGVVKNPSSGFPTLSTEWIQYSINEYRLLGQHSSVACGRTIETLALTAPAPYCPGNVLPVAFSARGNFNGGNQFRVELSDANGLFGSPTLLTGALALSGTDPSGTVNAIIPTVATTSANYRVRVVSTDPAAQTIINPPTGFSLSASASLANVSNPDYSSISRVVTLNWDNPTGCFDEIMIVVTAASGITFSPFGDGSDYTANPEFGAFNQVVYKGTGTSAVISNLTDGVVYYFEIFTRIGSTWSSGIEIGAIPDRYCIPTVDVCDSYIYNIQLNTINNTTPEGCGFNGYSSFINQSTTLVKGETYTINVGVGIVGDGIDISFFDDDIRVWIDYDRDGSLENNATERIVNINNNGAAGSYSFTVPTTVPTGSTRLRVRIVYDNEPSACGASNYGETEDYTVIIEDPCTPNAVISNFYPSSGPAGTEVRITGSNLNLVSGVSFNRIPATSYTIVDASTILAVVPGGAGTGRITLLDDVACRSLSTGNFTEIIPDTATCVGAYSELFISEVVDPNSGNNHYLEIYNGTGSDINLSSPASYSIRIGNRDNSGDDPQYTTISLSGIIPNGETRVYFLGANTASLATGSQSGPGTGYNQWEDVQLLKNGSVIDSYFSGNTAGYAARRRNDVNAPLVTFNAADWNVAAFSNANLSIFVPQSSFQITAQPSDASGCEVSLFVSTNNPGLSYQWAYNNNRGNNLGWTNLSDGAGTGVLAGTTISGATSTALLITGDMSNLDQYQFYCIVSLAGCTKPTEAVQFTLDPGRYWRTAGSGNWTDISRWENAPVPAGPWTAACAYPTLALSDSVVIQNTDSLIIDGAVTVGAGQLYISSGAKIRLETSSTLEIGNRPGPDFVLMGVLEDNSTASNGLFLTNTATWLMGPAGELIRTGNSSQLKYREQYEGGIINIPATAIWRYRKVSATNPPILSASMYYPNLYFENFSGGTYNQTATSAFQTIQTCIVKGSLFIGATGTAMTARNTVAGVNFLQVNGNLFVGSGSTFINQDGTNFGNGLLLGGNLEVEGILTANATGAGRLILNGSGMQVISGSGTISIDTLVLNKTSQSLVQLQRNITVIKLLQFGTGGIIQTGNNTITISNGDVNNAIQGVQAANATGVYDNDRYVFGNLARRITNGSTDTYTFPVGDAPPPTGIGYNPSRIQIVSTPNSNTITASFKATSPGSINVFRTVTCPIRDRIVNHVGFTGLGYWQADGGNTTNYNVWLHPNVLNTNTNPNFDIVATGFVNNYRALKEDNSRAGLPWDPAVVEAGDPCVVSTNYYQIPGFGYSGFSIFAPGGGGTALPVELLSFTASCASDGVTLNWQTASEQNSDFFSIERSADGINFDRIGVLRAAGNSNALLSYSFLDRANSGALTYYRLTETDFDGQEYRSPIISTECDDRSDRLQIFFAPGDGIVANVYNENQEAYTFAVFDAAGREVYNSILSLGGGAQRVNLLSTATLPKGMYFVAAFYGNKVATAKVVVY
jgi:hypothetical protein